MMAWSLSSTNSMPLATSCPICHFFQNNVPPTLPFCCFPLPCTRAGITSLLDSCSGFLFGQRVITADQARDGQGSSQGHILSHHSEPVPISAPDVAADVPAPFFYTILIPSQLLQDTEPENNNLVGSHDRSCWPRPFVDKWAHWLSKTLNSSQESGHWWVAELRALCRHRFEGSRVLYRASQVIQR